MSAKRAIPLSILRGPHSACSPVQPPPSLGIDDNTEDYDPWEPFNAKIFTLNCALDRYVLSPVATGYHSIVLPGEQQAIHNMFDNVAMPKRLINSLLQGKFQGAGRELARFLINTTVGMGGWPMSRSINST